MKKRQFLIYDDQCAFCTGIASLFHKWTYITIVPLSMSGGKDNRLCFVDNGIYYYNAEACLHVLAQIPFLGILSHLYFWPIKYMFDTFYFVIKKLRKIL